MFWGAMTGRPLLGLLLAVVVEGAHWTRLRWEFNDGAFIRAWRLCALATAGTTALIWLEGNPHQALPQLLTWLPLLLLPMQFVQAYGLRTTMPISTFSFFVRQRRARNRRLGLQETLVHFNFGNAYFVTALVSSTLGRHAESPLYLAGLLVLAGWLLLKTRLVHPAILVMALTVAGGLAVGGQKSLNALHDWLMNQGGNRYGRSNAAFDANFSQTAIGAMGEIKQSPEIIWRLRTPPGALPPTHLRTASYQRYQSAGGVWLNAIPPGVANHDKDFIELPTVEPHPGEVYRLLGDAADPTAVSPDLPRISLRGPAQERTPLPAPGNAASLTGFDLIGAEKNSFGTIRVFPNESIIHGSILYGHPSNPESDPWKSEDLSIPNPERDGIREALEMAGLDQEATLDAKLGALRHWMFQNFTYTRYLTKRGPHHADKTAITRFLLEERSGHCEYFATAAALMLRQSGIPTRYAKGFAVMEHDARRGEWVIRGTHGHAWCRVWDQDRGEWIDFDPTPPDWLNLEPDRASSFQWLKDGFQRMREDFFIWRSDPANRLKVTVVLAVIGLAGLAFVSSRLWRSRRRVENPGLMPGVAATRTALHGLESDARRILGERPPGMTFARWLDGLRARLPDAGALDEALALHQRLRFDPAPAEARANERLATLAERIRQGLLGKPTG